MINGSIQNAQQLAELNKRLMAELEKGPLNYAFTGKCLEAVEFDLEAKRTGQQNKAMHKYFTMLASALNDAGTSDTINHYNQR